MMKLPPQRRRLTRSFYARATPTVAQQLLGKALVRRIDGQWVGGLIVETEAYLPADDLAAHSARGKTASNAAMFQQPGTLYVYPIHAKHCLNAVAERAGIGGAVLIRAIEPIWNVEVMQRHRGHDDLRRLTRGPAMLCQALQVDRGLDGVDLVRDPQIAILDTDLSVQQVTIGQRIGISKAKELPLRFFINGNRYVSGRASDHSSHD